MNKSLAVIGIGAFGEFSLKYLTPYFDVTIYDVMRDLAPLQGLYNVKVAGSLADACKSDIIIISVPVQAIDALVQQIKAYIRPGQLVIDVASVKCLPAKILADNFGEGVDLVSVHPLFGPQSGRNGIKGLNMAVVNVRGDREQCVIDFFKLLELNVMSVTAEEHDAQLAYVQGLTHMIAKVFQKIDMPDIVLSTKTFELLREMVGFVKDDSDALFQAIQRDNPFVDRTKEAFFTAVKELEDNLHSITKK